jgi:hypothetical protein
MHGSIAQSNPETLTNKTIMTLQKAGIGSATMQSMIAATPCQFTVDSKSLIELKKNGVADEVITAMVQKASNGTTPAVSATGIVAQLKSQGTGIYWLKEAEQLEELEPTVYAASKQGSGILTSITYGLAKTKNKMALNGNNANLQLNTRRPTFYFFFGNEGKSLNDQTPAWFASATSPNEFMVVKFDSGKKGREVVIATTNAYQGAEVGVDDSSKAPFQFKKLEKGMYVVTFDRDLAPGEYCFMYAGSMNVNGIANPKVYDFGIRP